MQFAVTFTKVVAHTRSRVELTRSTIQTLPVQHCTRNLSQALLTRLFSFSPTFCGFQGHILFKDGSRAVLQYSVPRNGDNHSQQSDSGSAKIIRDWVCAKVTFNYLFIPLVGLSSQPF